MGILFFLLGLCCFLAGCAALAFDALFYFQTNTIDPVSVAILWQVLLEEQSMLAAEDFLKNTLGGPMWVNYGQPYWNSPAFLTPMGLALFFWLLAMAFKKPKIKQEEVESLATSGSTGGRRRGGGRRS